MSAQPRRRRFRQTIQRTYRRTAAISTVLLIVLMIVVAPVTIIYLGTPAGPSIFATEISPTPSISVTPTIPTRNIVSVTENITSQPFAVQGKTLASSANSVSGITVTGYAYTDLTSPPGNTTVAPASAAGEAIDGLCTILDNQLEIQLIQRTPPYATCINGVSNVLPNPNPYLYCAITTPIIPLGGGTIKIQNSACETYTFNASVDQTNLLRPDFVVPPGKTIIRSNAKCINPQNKPAPSIVFSADGTKVMSYTITFTITASCRYSYY